MTATAVGPVWGPITVRDYLVVSTVLSVFGLQRVWGGPFDLWACYLIVVPNCLLLLAYNKLCVHRVHLLVLVGMFCVSLVATRLAGYPIGVVIMQIAGFSVMSIYHYSAASLEQGIFRRLFSVYCVTSILVAAHAILLWLIKAALGEVDRLHGIFYEPANYVCATLPAIAYYLYTAVRERQNFLPLSILGLSFVLADSSQGYIGLLVAFFLLIPRRSMTSILAAALACLLIGGALYTLSENFQLRLQGMLQVRISQDAIAEARLAGDAVQSLDTTNGSTLALVSNGYVAYRTFMESPWIGTGLGTHRFNYDKYAPEILDPSYRLYGLNQLDANSLVLRMMSETGLLGLLLVAYFLFYFSRVNGRDPIMVRDAILPYFVIELMRHGNYFAPENLFFAMIFVLNYVESRRTASSAAARPVLRDMASGFAIKGTQ